MNPRADVEAADSCRAGAFAEMLVTVTVLQYAFEIAHSIYVTLSPRPVERPLERLEVQNRGTRHMRPAGSMRMQKADTCYAT